MIYTRKHTGFSVVSVKKILICISNSPHPVSCTSKGGDVKTTFKMITTHSEHSSATIDNIHLWRAHVIYGATEAHL